MKKIISLVLVVLWFSGYVSANQINSVNKGGEEGTARYYAANLKGKLTSFGEKYDDSQLTASHSKYPLNTLLKVTNLSKEAASKLGMMASGKAKVRLEVVSQPTPEKTIDKALDLLSKGREVTAKEETKEAKATATTTKTPAEPFSINHTYDISGVEKNPKGFGVQVTALSSLNMVQDLYDELVKMGIKKEEIYVQMGAKDTTKIYRLMFGEFYTKEAANEKMTWLSQHGYKGVVRSHFNL
jgi:rare lipoprotein A